MKNEVTPRIKALLFDFDGLILDTETPDYVVWQSIYREHGFELPHEQWGSIIGTSMVFFDAADHLSGLLEGQLDSASLRTRHRDESNEMTLGQAVMPGVLDYLREAKQLGLRLAIASSSPHSWVDTHAKRLGIFDYFDKVITSDEVGIERTKPHPDLFLLALKELNVQKNEAIVFEDSPNGVRAAQASRIR